MLAEIITSWFLVFLLVNVIYPLRRIGLTRWRAVGLVLVTVVFMGVIGLTDEERAVAEQKRVAAHVADGDKDAVIFDGYDSLWQTQTIIERRDGWYYLDGDKMEEKRHRNMPTDGLALVLVDRIGEPDNYFLVRDGRMDIYTGCEYGPCTLKRTIRQ